MFDVFDIIYSQMMMILVPKKECAVQRKAKGSWQVTHTARRVSLMDVRPQGKEQGSSKRLPNGLRK